MTDDSDIISSGKPHEVHLAEGSRTAVHKTAAPMEPQVRNTIANPDEEVQLIEIVQGVSKSQGDELRLAHGQAAADGMQQKHPDAVPSEAADHRVGEDGESAQQDHAPAHAQPLDQVMSDLPSLELSASDGGPDDPPAKADSPAPETPAAAMAPQEADAPADTSDKAAELAPSAAYMEEMNFPARVVKLKIANDHIRGQIEKLEKPLFPPVPVQAPEAKDKDKAKTKGKEADKKPAKGH